MKYSHKILILHVFLCCYTAIATANNATSEQSNNEVIHEVAKPKFGKAARATKAPRKPIQNNERITPGTTSFIRTHFCLNIDYNPQTEYSKTIPEIVDFWPSGFVIKFNVHESNLNENNSKFAIRFTSKSCKGGSLRADAMKNRS